MKAWALKGSGHVQWARFTEQPNGQIYILALISISSYINKPLSKDEARKKWRELVQKGWKQVPIEEAMDEKTLQIWIFD